MNRKKLIIGLVIVVGLAAVIYANLNTNRSTGVEVETEKITRHDLEAIVSASGKIRPQRSVNVSAETMGKVVGLAVNEGDVVKQGQFLLQIDPRNLQTQVNSREASLAAARSQLLETEASIENARTNLRLAEEQVGRQRELFKSGLTPRETLDRAETDVKLRQADLTRLQQSMKTQQTRLRQDEAALEDAEFNLNKVRLVSPINGIVTRRNIEEGETVVVGTMNNAGTVLMTIADLSVIETEVEVDETDIPFIELGQPAKVKIDAFPDKEFTGRVTEVGNSAIQTAGAAAQRATNFKVIVTLEGEVPNVRPGFTCTTIITTATRQKAIAVPIQATTVREMVVNADGSLVRAAAADGQPSTGRRVTAPTELQPGQSRKEIEGSFVIRDGRAVFTPIKVGIAGEKFFEVLDGLVEGDEVITGPFASVRTLKDGDTVKVTTSTGTTTAPSSSVGIQVR
ncbi:MAG: HlyD family efflux transporter periplasmic adaptor subunit [Acidimicrobiia bacterium]|nr:HlyD family efflux transporter periplasmic adaptor subunit [Acidimicrobiia bacterium]